MRVKKLGKLRYNIWFYFLLFTVVIIAVLWVSQVLLFDYIYQRRKYAALEETGKKVYEQFNTDEPVTQERFNDWINKSVSLAEDGYSIYLAKYQNGYITEMETVFGMSASGADSSINHFSVVEQDMVSTGIRRYLSGTEDYVVFRFDGETVGAPNNGDTYYVFCGTVENDRFGENLYLIISTPQKSLSSTVSVIQIQLVIVSVLIIILSFFLSMYISNKLARPTMEMSETAKKWADGDRNVTFKADGYEELQELADALNYAKEGIAKTGRMQADLLANVSHDLKTPLTMIKAYAEMIRDFSGNDEKKRLAHTKIIIDETDRLTMLVNDILDLSKLQDGMNVTDESVFDMSELCKQVVSKFSEFAKKDGYTLICEIEDGLKVKADKKKIEQVVYNLIGNSINYTGEDKTVKIFLRKKGDKIVFETIDSGKGISEEKVKTIWERYYRDSETHQRPVKGTGLGLSIVKTILENHNLRFGVITKKGVGSNFFIEFGCVNNE